MNLLEEYHQWLSEGEHWDKVRRNDETEIQNAQQYAQQMLDQHGDDETVQKLCAAILKLNPNSQEHKDQILDASEQLNDYVAQQVGHKPKDEKGKKTVKESYAEGNYKEALGWAKQIQDDPAKHGEEIANLARRVVQNAHRWESMPGEHKKIIDYVKNAKLTPQNKLRR